MRKSFYILLCCLIVFASCKKDTGNHPPQISLVSVTPTVLKQFEDSIHVLIHYTDEDGDIGFYDADSAALYVLDKRLSTADSYFIQPLNPPGDTLQIEGEIDFFLRNLFLLGSGTEEKTTFKIKLKDRNGHWSNEIETTEITIQQ